MIDMKRNGVLLEAWRLDPLEEHEGEHKHCDRVYSSSSLNPGPTADPAQG